MSHIFALRQTLSALEGAKISANNSLKKPDIRFSSVPHLIVLMDSDFNNTVFFHQDFELNSELKTGVISLLEEVLRDPDLLPQERKATNNILRYMIGEFIQNLS